MNQILEKNCINLDTEIFDLGGMPFTVEMFLQLHRLSNERVKQEVIERFGTRFKDKAKVLNYMKRVTQCALGIYDISEEDYIKDIESISKMFLDLLGKDVACAVGFYDFERLKIKMPDIVNLIEMYGWLGGVADYYSQTCADLFVLYVRIQNGLGDIEGASATKRVLYEYVQRIGNCNEENCTNRSSHQEIENRLAKLRTGKNVKI